LSRHRKVGLDTSLFIFQVEENKIYFHLTDAIFSWLERSSAQAVTSTVTLLELLVQSYQLADIDRVNKFYALLSTFPHLEWVAPTLQIADMGARLRAEYNLRTPDAVQAATAVSSDATGFISNDTAFRRVAGLNVMVLDDLLETESSRKR
jgi:predicted nucleic acid-binding protein